MSASRSILRTLGGALAVVFAGGILASSALGSLTIDLRVRTSPPESPDPPTFTNGVAVEPGDLVKMEVWAVVTDGNGTVRDDGLNKFYSSFLSTNGGLILGNLISLFPADEPHSMWGGGTGVDKGVAGDLDGDGDDDVGSNEVSGDAPPMFMARASNNIELFTDKNVPVYDEFLCSIGEGPCEAEVEAWKVEHDTNEWFVGRLFFVAAGDWNETIDPATGRPGVVEIWARPRQYNAAAWMEDGELLFNYVNEGAEHRGLLVSGDKVILYVASHAEVPDGSGPFEVAPGGLALVLNGSASTGSINWWGWDFDGDGNYEIEGVGEEEVTVTYEYLTGEKGLVAGDYTAKMTVGWSQSDPVNTDTAEFGFRIVPEPATIALLLAGCLVTGMRRRR